MKFVELKQSLKGQVQNVYIIYGQDRFLQDKSINLIKQFAVDSFVEMNESIYNDENLNVQQMLEEAQTLPFMSKFRFILIRDCFNKMLESDKKMILDYLKKPVKTTVFVMCDDEKNDFFKKCENSGAPVDCNYLDEKTLESLVPAMCSAEGKQITANAMHKLIEYCARDLGRINNEIKKLACYCEDAVIKPEDVDINVAKTLDYETYRLANAICQRDYGTAMKLFEYIMQEKGSTQYLIGALGNFMRRYFYLQATKQDKDLCLNTFKIGEYPYKMMIKESGVLKKNELMNSLNEILLVDYKIKSGRQTDENALYSLITHLTRNL